MQNNQLSNEVKRPPLRYYGGGWNRAPWIISHFPRHDNYLEPCFGAGGVLLRKKRAKLETVNDLDERVINFFQVLRERPRDLIDMINLSPWAENEIRAAADTAADPLEDSRRFFMLCWGSIHGGPTGGSKSVRIQTDPRNRWSSPPNQAFNRDDLLLVAARLKSLQILNRDALGVIDRFLGSGCLVYFDPPYVVETRSRASGYTHEVTNSWHVDAADLLRRHNGPVVVSGYASPLYVNEYEDHGWARVDRQFRTNGSDRIESIWLNSICQKQIAGDRLPLFNLDNGVNEHETK